MMLEQALTVFVCQYIMIGLLGLQSLNVRDGQKVHAAFTSLLLGIVGFQITGIISSVYSQGMLSLVFVSFVLAGPLGIYTSMCLHQHFKEKNEKPN